MMKKIIFFLVFTVFFFKLSQAQRKTLELGPFIGYSYYLGELNPKTHVGEGVGDLAFGALLRYNLNKRYSLKATLIRAPLSGHDEAVDFQFNQVRNASFEAKLTEFAGTIEFNFLPYKTGDKDHFFTPYLFVGFSVYKVDPETSVNGVEVNYEEGNTKTGVALPFGPGMKLSLNNKFSLSMEWGFRKTGYDALDGLPNRLNEIFEYGKEYDNDWYVITGFSLTYKITNEGSCPFYNF